MGKKKTNFVHGKSCEGGGKPKLTFVGIYLFIFVFFFFLQGKMTVKREKRVGILAIRVIHKIGCYGFWETPATRPRPYIPHRNRVLQSASLPQRGTVIFA